MPRNELHNRNWSGKWSNVSGSKGQIIPAAAPPVPTAPEPLPDTHDAVTFARQVLDFHPDATQADVMSCLSNRILLNCTRQWGKSTTTAALAAWHLIAGKPRQTILVVSPSGRQSGELVDKVKYFFTKAGLPAKGDGRNESSILMPNGSRVIGLPGTDGTIRGFSAPDILIIDEAARVDDETYKAVKPSLAVSNGVILLLSTPCGQRGFFWDAWANGGATWTRFSVTADQCPRISRSFLDEERMSLQATMFRQEYMCEFHASDTQVFTPEMINACLTDDAPWDQTIMEFSLWK